MSDCIDVVFDGPPSHESGRFIEVEDSTGASVKAGEWLQREDGYWVLRIESSARIQELEARVRYLEADNKAMFAVVFQAEDCVDNGCMHVGLEEAVEAYFQRDKDAAAREAVRHE